MRFESLDIVKSNLFYFFFPILSQPTLHVCAVISLAIPIFHLIFPGQRAVLLNYLGVPEIWKGFTHTHTHIQY